jgi:hypothetical protein
MIKVENMDWWGFEHAIRGMRNPMNSWEKSDSLPTCMEVDLCGGECGPWCDGYRPHIGLNDLALMKKLYQAGTEHRKYLRQIFVSMDITAPLYFWKEFDTYKIGVTANSCSTMHKIAAKEFKLDDFSHEFLFNGANRLEGENDMEYHENPTTCLDYVIRVLNYYRAKYIETKDKRFWWQMIQLLPSSYNQRRTITMNYENVVTIVKQRAGHKLDEWNNLVKILYQLPYVNEIMEFMD